MLKPKANRRRVPGKPDAGNPPVRFDEGWRDICETDNTGQFNSPIISLPTLPGLHLNKKKFRAITSATIHATQLRQPIGIHPALAFPVVRKHCGAFFEELRSTE